MEPQLEQPSCGIKLCADPPASTCAPRYSTHLLFNFFLAISSLITHDNSWAKNDEDTLFNPTAAVKGNQKYF